VGEAEDSEARGGVLLVALGGAGLLGRSAVVTQPIRLDHEAVVREPEVDLVAQDKVFREREGEARRQREWPEENLQVRIGQAERMTASFTARSSRSALSSVARSIKVWTGVVTVIPCHLVMLLPGRDALRRVLIPGLRILPAPRVLTSIRPSSRPIPHNAAALRWLNTASPPQASTAAIQRPSGVSGVQPTA
jgi:hypothetical protein